MAVNVSLSPWNLPKQKLKSIKVFITIELRDYLLFSLIIIFPFYPFKQHLYTHRALETKSLT